MAANMTKADFIRAHGKKSSREIVALAKKRRMHVTVHDVNAVRSADRRRARVKQNLASWENGGVLVSPELARHGISITIEKVTVEKGRR